MRAVPCGAHVGVRTTFVDNAADVKITTFRKPPSIDSAVSFLTAAGKVDPHYPMPSWKAACKRTEAGAAQHVRDKRLPQVGDYIQRCGIESECERASIAYGKWSAAAEYRLLASKGICVGDITLEELEPFLAG